MTGQIIQSDRPFLRDLRLRSFDTVLSELEKLEQAPKILLSPGWNLPHTFDHCARSIEHAIQGFPELKNAAFRTLVGYTAFKVFDMRGYLSHNLTDEIPGDADPSAGLGPEIALLRLKNSIEALSEWQGPLMPHFAYGTLSKSQYERANAMHIANHLAAMEY